MEAANSVISSMKNVLTSVPGARPTTTAGISHQKQLFSSVGTLSEKTNRCFGIPLMPGILSALCLTSQRSFHTCQHLSKNLETKSQAAKPITKPNQCHICEKVLKSKQGLAQHIDCVHKKLKPFACPDCDKSFGQKSTLTQHINIVHNKSKPFDCPMCRMSFGLNHYLKSHVDCVHYRLKPFTCSECNTSLGQRSTLQRHMKLVHKKVSSPASS